MAERVPQGLQNDSPSWLPLKHRLWGLEEHGGEMHSPGCSPGLAVGLHLQTCPWLQLQTCLTAQVLWSWFGWATAQSWAGRASKLHINIFQSEIVTLGYPALTESPIAGSRGCQQLPAAEVLVSCCQLGFPCSKTIKSQAASKSISLSVCVYFSVRET